MKRRAALFVLALTPLFLVATGRSARAQSAEAQELFDEGRRALAAGDYTTACARLDASERIERAVGTLLSLAECEEGLGQLASERLHLQEAASWADATHDSLNRGPVARKRLAEIEKRVPRLTFRRAPNAPAGSRVTRDGVDLGTAAFDVPLPVDTGRHTIVVSTPGRADATYMVALAEGEQKTLVVDGAGAEIAPSSSTSSVDGPRRTWAYALGGVGVAGIAVGAIFGVKTLSTWSQAQRDCGAACAPGSVGQTEGNQAHGDAVVSTVAFSVAAAALAAGAYLFFSSRHDAPTTTVVRVAPWAAVGSAGAVIGGTWP
jgi:hypothetical protein